MNDSKLMKERIRRVRVLFKELGYEIYDSQRDDETYSAGFENEKGFQGGFFIDKESKFLELAFTFSFSIQMGTFITTKLEEMLQICYEYGCYINLEKTEEEINFSIFSKIYFAGLNYFSLKETVRDFKECVSVLKESVELTRP
jgi:hypothetical protein